MEKLVKILTVKIEIDCKQGSLVFLDKLLRGCDPWYHLVAKQRTPLWRTLKQWHFKEWNICHFLFVQSCRNILWLWSSGFMQTKFRGCLRWNKNVLDFWIPVYIPVSDVFFSLPSDSHWLCGRGGLFRNDTSWSLYDSFCELEWLKRLLSETLELFPCKHKEGPSNIAHREASSCNTGKRIGTRRAQKYLQNYTDNEI